MPLGLPIFLANGEGSSLEFIVWLVAGILWFVAQVKAAKKKQARKARPPPSAPSVPAAPGGGDSPTANELAEIFKRLGADIPGTPPPASKPAPARMGPMSPSAPRTEPPRRPPPAPPRKQVLAAKAQPATRRPPRPKPEIPFHPAPAAPILPSAVQGVESRQGEHHALGVSTRHTGMILPRMYAMGLRLAPWPQLPMPALDPSRHARHPLRARLHAPREIRDALVVQNYLRPPKSLAP